MKKSYCLLLILLGFLGIHREVAAQNLYTESFTLRPVVQTNFATKWGDTLPSRLNFDEAEQCIDMQVSAHLSVSAFLTDINGNGKYYIYTNKAVTITNQYSNTGTFGIAVPSVILPATPPTCFSKGTVTIGFDVVVSNFSISFPADPSTCSNFGNNKPSFSYNPYPCNYTTGTGAPTIGATVSSGVYTMNAACGGYFYSNAGVGHLAHFTKMDAVCGGPNGTATAIPDSGGTAPFTYQWSTTPVQTTQTAVGLSPGHYSCTITGDTTAGCKFVYIIDPININTAAPAYTYPKTINGTVINTTNNSWSSSLTVDDDIIVPSGQTLTISGASTTIGFSYQGNIIVQPGGSLVVNNATLTGGCNSAWPGISASAAVQPTGVGAYASINLSGATIANAQTSVSYLVTYPNGKPPFPTPTQTILTPVLITANSTTFTSFDLENAVVLREELPQIYVYNAKGAPIANITNCTFTANNTSFITGYGNFTMNIGGCSFSNATLYPQQTAISAIGFAALNVTSGCTFQGMGIGIQSDENPLTVTGSQFSNMLAGIRVTNGGALLYETSNITGNTFTSTVQGIHIEGSINDKIGGPALADRNTFTNIPHGAQGAIDPNFYHAYGVRVTGGSGYDIENNIFTGDGVASTPTNGVIYGSHGIITENTSASSPVIFNNIFTQSDYGVHTEQDNLSLKIRCNNFSNDGTAHFVSAWYTPNGQLRRQGDPSCFITDSSAAGNKWADLCNSGTTQDVFSAISFKYYANPSDQFGKAKTIPKCSSSTWYSSDLSTNCQPATLNSCNSPSPGIPPHGGGGLPVNCVTYVQQLQANIDNLLGQRTVLQNTITALTNPILGNNPVSATIQKLGSNADDLAKEAQLVTNELTRTLVTVCPGSGNIKNILKQSQLIEPKRLLAGINLSEGNAADLQSTLATITQMNNSLVWNNAAEKALIQADNSQFVTYMTILKNALAQGRSILSINAASQHTTQLTQSELSTIRGVANAGSRTAIMAQVLLTQITGEQFANSITKLPAGSHARIGSIGSDEKGNQEVDGKPVFKLYPNPNDGTMSVEYAIDSKDNGVFELMDVTGRIVAKYPLSNETNKLNISQNQLLGGIYFYQLRVNDSVVLKDKVVIVH